MLLEDRILETLQVMGEAELQLRGSLDALHRYRSALQKLRFLLERAHAVRALLETLDTMDD